MKNTKVTLVPLTADNREQFILDNPWAFKCGAILGADRSLGKIQTVIFGQLVLAAEQSVEKANAR